MAANIGDPSYGVYQGNDWVWDRGAQTWNVSFLHTYSLTMFAGVVISFLSIAYFWRRQKYSWESLQILLILIVPGAIIGARLWFLISEGGWDKWYILSGLSIQGGIMGAVIFATPFLYYRRASLDFRTTLGIILPNIIIGQAIGRWGNFANHEVFGRVTSSESLDWMGAMKSHMLIRIHDTATGTWGVGEYRQPLFFYEFITSSVGYIFIVLVLLRKNWVKPGVTAGVYLLWYGIVRTSMEPLRASVDIMKWGSMPISLFLSVLMIVGGIILIVWWQFLSKKKYDLIQPIKERRLFLFGKKSDTKKQYLFFGEEKPNKVRIWLPNNEEEVKWSKRELNRGTRNEPKKWYKK